MARRTLQVVAFLCTLIVGVTSMAVIVTQTTWFKEWLRGFIVRQAEDYVNGRLSIGRLDGNLFYGVELEDVDITQNGETVVGVKDLRLDYNALTLIRGDVVLDSIRIDQPVVRVMKTADGWNIAKLIKARTPDKPQNRRTLEIGDIGISNGTVLLEGEVAGTSGTIDAPQKISRLDLSAGVSSDENELKVSIRHVSLRANSPEFGINALSGVVRRRDGVIAFENLALRTEETSLSVSGSVTTGDRATPFVDLQLSSDKFDTEEAGRLVPALRGYKLQPGFEIRAKGPLDGMAVELAAREQNVGEVKAALTVDCEAPGRRIAGTFEAEHFNVGPVARSQTLKSDITGAGRFDLALPEGGRQLHGTYNVTAPVASAAGYAARNVKARGRIDGQTIQVDASAAAYGAAVTTRGTIVARAPVALDLTGHAAHVDLRNLPQSLAVPRAPGDLQFTYTVNGRGEIFSGDVKMEPSTLVGANIADGTIATFRVGAGAPQYSAKGRVENLDLQRVGNGFGVSALDVERYNSAINADFDLSGSGGGRFPLTLDATGTATDSRLFGATLPRLDFTANLASGDAHVKAIGQFASLNPAIVTGNERIAGDVSGALDVDTTIRGYAETITAESVDASGRVNLANSTVGGLVIDTGIVDGSFARREGNLTQLAIVGPDVNVEAHGPIALNDSGASNLTVHAESATLERIGALVNQPLMGAAVVDATVTGNALALNAKGTLKGSNLGYAENSALSLDTTFDAAVPQLTPADATVKTNSTATFLEAGGQKINEATLAATYAMNQVVFDAAAKQQMRELQAAGTLVLHPDHREVHVTGLNLKSEMVQWSLAQGGDARVQFGKDRIQVNDVKLVSGDQTITADGVMGSPSEQLRVRADNVDVAQLDALFLNDQRISGRFSGTAVIFGPTTAPKVAADFAMMPGAFRDFTFETFGGKVDYAEDGLTLDVRLQQNAQSWVTAKGFAPMTLFRSTPAEGEAKPAASDTREADIAIESSLLDLGVIQGFTSYVTNVTGTLQANVRLTGTGTDPHLTGVVDIDGGSFSAPDLGTWFNGLDTHLDLKPDQITVSRMQVWDDHGQPLTIGGTLGVRAGGVEAVDISLKSDEFEILHNDLGRLKLDTDLRVTGEVLTPRLEGRIDVHTGTLNVDQVLAQTAADPYATSATSLAPTAPTVQTPGLFNALALNVTLGIPGNTVLNGQDLRPANSPIELGDMSATVGGAVEIRKNPREPLRISGEITTVRGNYTFQGRRFEIQRDGRIRFQGGDEIDPLLDIRARRVISSVEAFIRIQGTLQQPELTFSSNPPLDQADVLSLIVFNQSINELGEGQQVSLANQAASFAGGYLASGLSTSIRKALALDEFQIQASGEQGTGPELTVGEQIGDNLFFRVRQGFGSANQVTEVILEYQIKEYLRLVATGAEAQGGTQRTAFRRIERGGLDLIFFFSY